MPFTRAQHAGLFGAVRADRRATLRESAMRDVQAALRRFIVHQQEGVDFPLRSIIYSRRSYDGS